MRPCCAWTRKSQIQALDRMVPVLPMQPGLLERRSHDYYRHTEFLAFLKQIERAYREVVDADGVPDELHLVMDNYAAHKHPAVREWLEQNPRFKVHFTPTHASWMNLATRRVYFPVRRMISSTTRASGLVASMTIPSFGMSSFV